jgi:predicted amidohydrolase
MEMKEFRFETDESLPEVERSIRPGMAATLTVAMVSPILEQGNKSANLDKFIGYVKDSAAKGADIVLFPETCLTGYLVSKPAGIERPLGELYEWAETIPGPSVDRLVAAAKEYNVYIIMGMFEADSETIGHLYNSAAFVGPEGLVGTYRKNTICDFGLFSASQWGLGRGLEIPVWEIRKGWRIGIVICYDLVVPEVPRIAAVKGADLILIPSYTPKDIEHIFSTMLPARAIENSTGVAWADCAGTYYGPYLPKEGLAIGGGRMAVEANGAILVQEGSSDTEGMSLATFTAENLYKARGLFPQLRDRNPAAYRPLVEPKALARDVIPYKLDTD